MFTEWLEVFDTLRNTSRFQASLYLLLCVFCVDANDTSITQKSSFS